MTNDFQWLSGPDEARERGDEPDRYDERRDAEMERRAEGRLLSPAAQMSANLAEAIAKLDASYAETLRMIHEIRDIVCGEGE